MMCMAEPSIFFPLTAPPHGVWITSGTVQTGISWAILPGLSFLPLSGHPDGTNQAVGERWATRRWAAAADDTGDILVSYNLSKPNGAGGTTLFIIHNGTVVSSAQSQQPALVSVTPYR